MNTVKNTTNRAEAVRKAWETRRANAAAKAAPQIVEKVVEMKKTTAPKAEVKKAEKVQVKKAEKTTEFILDALTGEKQIKKASNPTKQRFFAAQGDDARLKSILLKVARGQEDASIIPAVTREYVKAGYLKFVQNNPEMLSVFAGS